MYLSLNGPSLIVLGILIIIVLIAIIVMYKNRKKGCCGCNKENCPYRNNNNDNKCKR